MDDNPYASPKHSGTLKRSSRLTFRWHSIAAVLCALASITAKSLSLSFASRSMIAVARGGAAPDHLVHVADRLYWCAIVFLIAAMVLGVQSIRKGTPVARLVVIGGIIVALTILFVMV